MAVGLRSARDIHSPREGLSPGFDRRVQTPNRLLPAPPHLMKRELHYNGIRFVMETIQQSDQTWKCEARVFITAEGVDVPSLAFETEQEAEADTRNEVQWLIDCLHPEDFQIGARLKALPH